MVKKLDAIKIYEIAESGNTGWRGVDFVWGTMLRDRAIFQGPVKGNPVSYLRTLSIEELLSKVQVKGWG